MPKHYQLYNNHLGFKSKTAIEDLDGLNLTIDTLVLFSKIIKTI